MAFSPPLYSVRCGDFTDQNAVLLSFYSLLSQHN